MELQITQMNVPSGQYQQSQTLVNYLLFIGLSDYMENPNLKDNVL